LYAALVQAEPLRA